MIGLFVVSVQFEVLLLGGGEVGGLEAVLFGVVGGRGVDEGRRLVLDHHLVCAVHERKTCVFIFLSLRDLLLDLFLLKLLLLLSILQILSLAVYRYLFWLFLSILHVRSKMNLIRIVSHVLFQPSISRLSYFSMRINNDIIAA